MWGPHHTTPKSLSVTLLTVIFDFSTTAENNGDGFPLITTTPPSKEHAV